MNAYFSEENFVVNPENGSDYLSTVLLTDLVNTDDAHMNVLGGYGMLTFGETSVFGQRRRACGSRGNVHPQPED